jgi:hypothetical protein
VVGPGTAIIGIITTYFWIDKNCSTFYLKKFSIQAFLSHTNNVA